MKAKRSSIELMVLSFVLLIAQAFSHDADQSDRVIVVTNEGSGENIMSALVSNDDSNSPEKPGNVDLKSIDLLTTWEGNQ